ncbi:MAG TPA: hypothetical protein PKH65_08290 [Bacteroidia bacterium]|nr:hypothetical protein [Bacteroidia bacterium]HNT80666.1 hypothetical protein [Bacteroidia bacterium]
MRSILLYLLIITCIACEKNTLTQASQSSPTNQSIRAGIYDTTFIHHQPATAIALNIVWDSQNLYGSATDSLDLDLDNQSDLYLNLRLLNPDSLHLLSGMPNPFPYLSLGTTGNMQFMQRTETVYAGLGTIVTYHWADTLSYNQTIADTSNWYIHSSNFIKLWGENPGSIGTPGFGTWYTLNDIRYIAFMKNQKLGWIAINNSNRNNPLITEWAIQK